MAGTLFIVGGLRAWPLTQAGEHGSAGCPLLRHVCSQGVATIAHLKDEVRLERRVQGFSALHKLISCIGNLRELPRITAPGEDIRGANAH